MYLFYLWLRIAEVERLLLRVYRRGNRMHVVNLVELVYARSKWNSLLFIFTSSEISNSGCLKVFIEPFYTAGFLVLGRIGQVV